MEYRNALKVVALDARTGRIVWERTAYDGLMYDNRHRKNTYASSTPVTDGRLVYAYFEAAGIYAYDFDGALVWSSSLGKIAKGGMGPGTSPILFEDLVIVQADQEMGAGSAIVALDKRTGKEVWRTARTTRRSWATPLVVDGEQARRADRRRRRDGRRLRSADRARAVAVARHREPSDSQRGRRPSAWSSSPPAARPNARWRFVREARAT